MTTMEERFNKRFHHSTGLREDLILDFIRTECASSATEAVGDMIKLHLDNLSSGEGIDSSGKLVIRLTVDELKKYGIEEK